MSIKTNYDITFLNKNYLRGKLIEGSVSIDFSELRAILNYNYAYEVISGQDLLETR